MRTAIHILAAGCAMVAVAVAYLVIVNALAGPIINWMSP